MNLPYLHMRRIFIKRVLKCLNSPFYLYLLLLPPVRSAIATRWITGQSFTFTVFYAPSCLAWDWQPTPMFTAAPTAGPLISQPIITPPHHPSFTPAAHIQPLLTALLTFCSIRLTPRLMYIYLNTLLVLGRIHIFTASHISICPNVVFLTTI